jgi:hypothetical protein
LDVSSPPLGYGTVPIRVAKSVFQTLEQSSALLRLANDYYLPPSAGMVQPALQAYFRVSGL